MEMWVECGMIGRSYSQVSFGRQVGMLLLDPLLPYHEHRRRSVGIGIGIDLTAGLTHIDEQSRSRRAVQDCKGPASCENPHDLFRRSKNTRSVLALITVISVSFKRKSTCLNPAVVKMSYLSKALVSREFFVDSTV
jgi:hypothetical protein